MWILPHLCDILPPSTVHYHHPEQVSIPQFSFADLEFFAGRTTMDMHTQKATPVGAWGVGRLPNSSILFLLFWWYFMLCPVIHTFLLYLWLSDVQMPESIHTSNYGRYKIIFSQPFRPFVWVFFPLCCCCWLSVQFIEFVHIPGTIQIWKLYNG